MSFFKIIMPWLLPISTSTLHSAKNPQILVDIIYYLFTRNFAMPRVLVGSLYWAQAGICVLLLRNFAVAMAATVPLYCWCHILVKNVHREHWMVNWNTTGHISRCSPTCHLSIRSCILFALWTASLVSSDYAVWIVLRCLIYLYYN